MQHNPDIRNARIDGLLVGGILLPATLTACSRDQPPQDTVVAPPAAAPPQAEQVQSDVATQDDYVYYPQYEVYYSSSRHQYAYREGSAWVSRLAPAHVAINVLLASPSVRMNFHDSPALHHEDVARSYPRNWSPPAKSRDDHKGDQRDDRKDRH